MGKTSVQNFFHVFLTLSHSLTVGVLQYVARRDEGWKSVLVSTLNRPLNLLKASERRGTVFLSVLTPRLLAGSGKGKGFPSQRRRKINSGVLLAKLEDNCEIVYGWKTGPILRQLTGNNTARFPYTAGRNFDTINTEGTLISGVGMVVSEGDPTSPMNLLTKQQWGTAMTSSFIEEEVALTEAVVAF